MLNSIYNVFSGLTKNTPKIGSKHPENAHVMRRLHGSGGFRTPKKQINAISIDQIIGLSTGKSTEAPFLYSYIPFLGHLSLCFHYVKTAFG